MDLNTNKRAIQNINGTFSNGLNTLLDNAIALQTITAEPKSEVDSNALLNLPDDDYLKMKYNQSSPVFEVEQTTDGYKYNCLICYDQFSQTSDLESHLKIHDDNPCEYFDTQNLSETDNLLFQEYQKANDLLKVNKIAKEESVFSCNACDFSASTSEGMDQHSLSHTESEVLIPKTEQDEYCENLYQCLLCEFSTQLQDELTKHVKTHEQLSTNPPVKCLVCPKSFKCPNELQQHIDSHEADRVYKCLLCRSFVTKSKSSLSRHIYAHVNKRLENRITEVDVESLVDVFAYNLQLEGSVLEAEDSGVTFDSVRRLYKCSKCNFKNSRKGKVFSHVKSVHANIKMFSCIDCNKKFSSEVVLASHKNLHKIQNKVFRCSMCSFNTDKKGLLEVHMHCHRKRNSTSEIVICETSRSDGNSSDTVHDDNISLEKPEAIVPFLSEVESSENTAELDNFKYFAVIEGNKVSTVIADENVSTGELESDPLSLIDFVEDPQTIETSHPKTVEVPRKEPVSTVVSDDERDVDFVISDDSDHSRHSEFQCKECSYYADSTKALQSHVKKSHKSQYQCMICLEKFAYPLAYKKHVESHIRRSDIRSRLYNKDVSNAVNSWHCTICQKRFINKAALVSHSKVHSKVSSKRTSIPDTEKKNKPLKSNAKQKSNSLYCSPYANIPRDISNSSLLHYLLDNSVERIVAIVPNKNGTSASSHNTLSNEPIVIDSSDEENPKQKTLSNRSANPKNITLVVNFEENANSAQSIPSNNNLIELLNGNPRKAISSSSSSCIPVIDITNDNIAPVTTTSATNLTSYSAPINVPFILQKYLGEKVTTLSKHPNNINADQSMSNKGRSLLKNKVNTTSNVEPADINKVQCEKTKMEGTSQSNSVCLSIGNSQSQIKATSCVVDTNISNEETFSCSVCEKTLQSSLFETHMKYHFDEFLKNRTANPVFQKIMRESLCNTNNNIEKPHMETTCTTNENELKVSKPQSKEVVTSSDDIVDFHKNEQTDNKNKIDPPESKAVAQKEEEKVQTTTDNASVEVPSENLTKNTADNKGTKVNKDFIQNEAETNVQKREDETNNVELQERNCEKAVNNVSLETPSENLTKNTVNNDTKLNKDSLPNKTQKNVVKRAEETNNVEFQECNYEKVENNASLDIPPENLKTTTVDNDTNIVNKNVLANEAETNVEKHEVVTNPVEIQERHTEKIEIHQETENTVFVSNPDSSTTGNQAIEKDHHTVTNHIPEKNDGKIQDDLVTQSINDTGNNRKQLKKEVESHSTEKIKLINTDCDSIENDITSDQDCIIIDSDFTPDKIPVEDRKPGTSKSVKQKTGESLISKNMNPEKLAMNTSDKPQNAITKSSKPNISHEKSFEWLPYKCSDCKYGADSPLNIAIHRRLMHSVYLCQVCNRKYLYLHSLHSHMVMHHKDIPFNVCIACGLCTSDENVYKEHMKLHEMKTQCGTTLSNDEMEVAETTMSNKERLAQINSEYYNLDGTKTTFINAEPEDATFLTIKKGDINKCTKCKYISTTIKGLAVHERLVHGRGQKRFCKVCNAVFMSANDLKEHMDYHKPIFRCFKCNFKAKSKKRLEDHVKDDCSQVNTPNREKKKKGKLHNIDSVAEENKSEDLVTEGFACTKCKFVTSTNEYLLQHIKTVHNNEKYSCVTCNCKFSTVSALRTHMKVHFFNCIACYYFTNDKAKMDKHMDDFHLNTKPTRTSKRRQNLNVEKADIDSIEELISPSIVYKGMLAPPRITRSKLRSTLKKLLSPKLMKSKSSKKEGRISKVRNPKQVGTKKPLHLSFSTTSNDGEEVSRNKIVERDNSKIVNNVMEDTSFITEEILNSMDEFINTKTISEDESANKCQPISGGAVPLPKRNKFNTAKRYKSGNKRKATNPAILHNCSSCAFVTKSKSGLKAHQMLHTGKLARKCTLCNYKTDSKHNMIRHLETDKGSNKFVCTFCNYSTKFKYRMKMHIILHSGERPHSCKLCSYKAKEKRTLYLHLYAHIIIKKKYSCKICKVRCKQKIGLLRHKKSGMCIPSI